jgi:hypothetical protein
MRRTRYVLLVGWLAVSAICFSTETHAWSEQLPDPMDFGVVYEKIAFEAADTDGNNLVSEAEFVRDAAAAFAGLDFNRDGKLTAQELGPHDAKRFARIDANRDGSLTFNEVMTYKMKAFKAADTNKDDALSFDEMVSSVTVEVAKE